MSDPAIEAARRAEAASGWWKSGGSTPWDSGYAADAAREALEPIRKRVKELRHVYRNRCDYIADGVRHALSELAPLIYECTCSDQDEHCPLHGLQVARSRAREDGSATNA